MIVNAWRRRRFGRLAGALAAGVLAVGAVSLGATASAATTTAGRAAGAVGDTASTGSAASTAGAAARARADVPWSKVGPGWVLAEYTNGAAGKVAPVTLYLI